MKPLTEMKSQSQVGPQTSLNDASIFWKFLSLVFAGAILIASQISAIATSFTNNFGLASPPQTITFDEFVLPDGTPITSQYSSLGVSFSPNLYLNSQGQASFPGIFENNAANFDPVVNPFQLVFSQVQQEVAFGLATNPAFTTFTALLNGVAVESFTTATTFDDANAFHGFSGILFNSIEVNVDSDLALIDTIQFESVPEPASVVLLLCGAALCLLRRPLRTNDRNA